MKRCLFGFWEEQLGVIEIAGSCSQKLVFQSYDIWEENLSEHSIHSCSMQVMMQEMMGMCDSKGGRYLTIICSRVNTSYSQKRQRAWGREEQVDRDSRLQSPGWGERMALLWKGKCVVLCPPHVVGWGQWSWNIGREPDDEGYARPPAGDENSSADNKKAIEGFAEEIGVIRFMLEKDDLSIQSTEWLELVKLGLGKQSGSHRRRWRSHLGQRVWDKSEACHGQYC